MRQDPGPELGEVIAFIQRHLCEPLSLEQLARCAGYSPYHFVRRFKSRMGLSPQYYVSALRLQRAKQLLLDTSLSIRDVGLEIGQQSLGTFTTRFTERVGVSPSQFRRSDGQVDRHLQSLRKLRHWVPTTPLRSSRHLGVEGVVSTTEPLAGVVLIGLFPRPIPEGLPLYGTVLPAPGSFCFTGVKPGTYHLLATSVAWTMKAADVLVPRSTLRGRSREPIVIDAASSGPVHRDVVLSPPRLEDPPILVSLPFLMGRFLEQGGIPAARIHLPEN